MSIYWILSLLGFLVFALFHSLLATRTLKEKLFNKKPLFKVYYRLVYNIIALTTLGLWFYLTVPIPARIIYSMPYPFSLLGYGIQIVALLLIYRAARQFGIARFLGLEQIRAYKSENTIPEYLDENHRGDMVHHGLYRWVRHPLYTFSLLFLISRPTMTTKWLVLIIIFAFYFWIGSHFEEKKLLIRFGDDYKEYQKNVPRMIPWKLPKHYK